jgi:hypothetical protein
MVAGRGGRAAVDESGRRPLLSLSSVVGAPARALASAPDGELLRPRSKRGGELVRQIRQTASREMQRRSGSQLLWPIAKG